MGRIGAFVIGGVVGAAVALLNAPRPGDETRAIITDWCNNNFGDRNNIAAGLGDRARQTVDRATAAGQQAYSSAASKVQEAAKNVPGVGAEPVDGDELRAKIEEARQRIAAQVVQNADGARETINETASTVSQALKDNAERVQQEQEERFGAHAAPIEEAEVEEVEKPADSDKE